MPDSNDEPGDPRHFRRSLVPLDIEDAESSPSLGRRLTRLFRRRDKKTGPAAGELSPPGRESDSPPENDFPESLDPENGDPGREI